MAQSQPLPGGSNSPNISCQAVTKTYKGATYPAVDQVSLEVPAGSFTVLLGPSGCGKTTLLKMINRLVEPDSGKIIIGGTEIHDLPATQLRRRIGYVIQQVGLFPHMTIAENIAVVPRMENWSKDDIRRRVAELLEMVDLPETYQDRYPRQLSGGEQQRVGLARALAADPGILLMDEPFGSLDAITRKNLQEQLVHIQRKVAKTVLFVTHDVEEALKLGAQVAVMRAGQLVQVGTPLEIVSEPRDAFVAQLVGSDNLLRRLSLMTAADALSIKNPDGRLLPLEATPGKESVTLEDDLRSVLSAMLVHGMESIPVTGADGRPVGTIHFNDLRDALEARALE